MLLLKLFNQSLVLNYSFEGVDLTCDATQDEDASLYVFISSEMEQDLMGLTYSHSPLKMIFNDDEPTIGNLNVLFDWKQTIPQPQLIVQLLVKPASVIHLTLDDCDEFDSKELRSVINKQL